MSAKLDAKLSSQLAKPDQTTRSRSGQGSSATTRYLRALFRPGELLCMPWSVSGTVLHPADQIIDFIEQGMQPAPFIAVNPLRDSRSDANVTAYRNFLIEFDEGTLEEQAQRLADFKVPYTTLTYSGGKSLHAVIALTEDVGAEAYAELAELIGIVLWESDPTQKNPSRLTRLAGAVRENGQEQTLIEVRRRISKKQLINWLSNFHAHIERTVKRREEEEAARLARLAELQAAGATGLDLVEERTLAFFRGERPPKGSRHGRLVAGCFELFECGVDYEQALEMATQAADLYGITADPKRANEAEQVVNYVYGLRRNRRRSRV